MKQRNRSLLERRDRFSIIADISEIAKSGVVTSQIMRKGNLSFEQIGHYLRFMLKTNLLERVDG